MKRLLARLKKDERGLTLVELLAVVVILAIIGGIAFVLIGNVIENSRKDAHIASALQVVSAAQIYESTGGQIGTGITGETLVTAEVLGAVTDPWTKGALAPSGISIGKTGTAYTVTLPGGTPCPITNRTDAQLRQGRSVVCPSTP